MQRTRALAELRTGAVDVLVVGRGCRRAPVPRSTPPAEVSPSGLVEQDDWASGTSSRSSRLAHGGLRYLEQREFGLVHEALTERGLLLDRLAPHLVRPVRFVLPADQGVGAALRRCGRRAVRRARPVRGASVPLPGHRHLSRKGRAAPGARRWTPSRSSVPSPTSTPRSTTPGTRWPWCAPRWPTAPRLPPGCRSPASSATTSGIVGVEALDRLTGEPLRIRARAVVVATGVWGPQTRGLLDVERRRPRSCRARASTSWCRSRPSTRTPRSSRAPVQSVLFLLPWGEHWLVGTTDTEWIGTLGANQDAVVRRRR